MTATAMSGNKDNVKINTPNSSSSDAFIDIEHYRKLVRNFIDLVNIFEKYLKRK